LKKIDEINAFKDKVIYEKTVFRLVSEINTINLTNEGFFDFTKLPNLRILDNGFLKQLRIHYNKSQREMAGLAEVPYSTWLGWEYRNKTIPFDKLNILSKKLVAFRV